MKADGTCREGGCEGFFSPAHARSQERTRISGACNNISNIRRWMTIWPLLNGLKWNLGENSDFIIWTNNSACVCVSLVGGGFMNHKARRSSPDSVNINLSNPKKSY